MNARNTLGCTIKNGYNGKCYILPQIKKNLTRLRKSRLLIVSLLIYSYRSQVSLCPKAWIRWLLSGPGKANRIQFISHSLAVASWKSDSRRILRPHAGLVRSSMSSVCHHWRGWRGLPSGTFTFAVPALAPVGACNSQFCGLLPSAGF